MQFMVDCHKKGKGNGLYKPKAQTARAYPGFLSMKNAYEYCYSPLDGMLAPQDYPQQYVAHTNLYMYTWVK